MADESALAEAIQLIKAGKKAEAQQILEPYILANPQNIQAWMWEAEIFPGDGDKIRVLEICLGHNPDHPQVTRALALLRSRSGIPPQVQAAAAPPEPEPPSADILASPLPPAPVLPVSPQPSPPSQTSARRQASVPQKPAAPRAPVRKHPDWPTVAGVVEVSEVRVTSSARVPLYHADIRAMYVVNGRDYHVAFDYARATGATPFTAEILTSNYAAGAGVVVSYDPRRPQKAWVDGIPKSSSESSRSSKTNRKSGKCSHSATARVCCRGCGGHWGASPPPWSAT